MIFLGIILLLSIALAEFKLEKRIYNPLSSYCLIWAIIIFLANLSLYGMRDVNIKTYILVFGGVFSFAIGYWVIFLQKNSLVFQYNRKNLFNDNIDYSIKYFVIKIGLMLCTIFYLNLAIRTLRLLLTGVGFVAIRNMHQGYASESIFNGDFEYLFHSLIGQPFLNVTVILLTMEWLKNKKHIMIMLICYLDILLFSFSTAGRFIILNIIIAIFLEVNLLGINLPDSIKRKARKYIGIAMGIILLITGYRAIEGGNILYSLFKTVYMYLASTIPLFDYWIEYTNKTGYCTYGGLFFYGMLDLLDSVIKYVFSYSIAFTSEIGVHIRDTEHFVRIYKDNSFNAFVSVFYYFYLDFRVFGVLAGNFIYGMLNGKSMKSVQYNINTRKITFFVLLIQGIVKSMVRWQFAFLPEILCFIYVIYLTKEGTNVN